MKENTLALSALKARKLAYAPYSRFLVGAAVLTENGKIYDGCNIENSSYGASVCAERTAVFKAVSDGESRIAAIAIAGAGDGFDMELPDYTPPCGVCLQVLSEFGKGDMRILLVKSENDYKEYSLKELFPKAFSL